MELNIPSFIPARAKIDEAEFNRLFMDNYTKLCAVALRIVCDPDEAEDLVEEAFWRLWKSPPPSDSNITGWLYRVTTNLGYNSLRRSRIRAKNLPNLLQFINLGSDQTPVEKVENKSDIEAVRQTLMRMSRRDVQLLVLRYSGMTYQQISEILSIAPGSIGTLLSRAEKKFAALHKQGAEHAHRR